MGGSLIQKLGFIIMNWTVEFKGAYNFLEDKLYQVDGAGLSIRNNPGHSDYENIELLNIKYEIDKNLKNFKIEDFKYWTLRIYRQLKIKETV